MPSLFELFQQKSSSRDEVRFQYEIQWNTWGIVWGKKKKKGGNSERQFRSVEINGVFKPEKRVRNLISAPLYSSYPHFHRLYYNNNS